MNSKARHFVDAATFAQIIATLFILTAFASCSHPKDDSSLNAEDAPNGSILPVDVPATSKQSTTNNKEQAQKSFAAWFAEGSNALEEGDNETAVAAFTKAIALDPKSSETLNSRGVAFLRMNRITLALKDFTSAIDISPRVPKYYGNRAIVYGDKNEYTRAIADLTVAIKLDSNSPNWYRQRSEAYRSQGNETLSKNDARKADRLENPSLALNPKDLSKAPSPNPKKMDPLANAQSTADLTKYQDVHDILEDIHEYTRLRESSPTELRILLNEMKKELEILYADLPSDTRAPVYGAYSKAFKLHDDACRVWEVFAKRENLLADAKTRWRKTVAENAIIGIKDSSLIDEIASFEFIIEKGHIPNTLFPSNSRVTTGLTDITQRHPEIAGKFNNYSFVMQHSMAYFFKQSELLTSLLFRNHPVEETPPYGLLDAEPSERLAKRLQAIRLTVILGDDAKSPLFQDTKLLQTIFKDWADLRSEMLKRADRMARSKRDQFIRNSEKGLVKLLARKYEVSHADLDKIQAIGELQNW